MDKHLLPSNYLELLSAIFIACAIISLICAIRIKAREFSVRIFAVFIILFIIMIANNWTTYLASIFIIASLMADTNYLLNLLAILRNNEAFFKYKKSDMTVNEAEQKVKDEYKSEELKVSSTIKDIVSIKDGKTTINFLYMTEQLALDEMEKTLGVKIERNVRVEKFPYNLELDGVTENYDIDLDGKPIDAIFEVKLFSTPNRATFNSYLNNVITHLNTYEKITKRKAIKYIVIIVTDQKFYGTIDRASYKTKIESIYKGCLLEFIERDKLTPDV